MRAAITGMGSNAIAKAVGAYLVQAGYEVVAIVEPGDVDVPTHLAVEEVDFSSKESVALLISNLSKMNFDVVVNCTTVLALDQDRSLRDESEDFDYEEFVRVTTLSIAPVAALCLGLKDSLTENACIINITSSAGSEGGFVTLSYNASKAAIDNLTLSLANILGTTRGVRVNGIAPGWIPPTTDAASGSVVRLANAITPSRRIGEPGDVVSAVKYLLASPFQNGSIIPVDGGITSSYLPYAFERLQMRNEISDTDLDKLIGDLERTKTGRSTGSEE